MTRDSWMNRPSDEDEGTDSSDDDFGSSNRQGIHVELFVVALVLTLGVCAVLLALLTRKRLFARQISPAESPIQVT
jgi:hypothetical protein